MCKALSQHQKQKKCSSYLNSENLWSVHEVLSLSNFLAVWDHGHECDSLISSLFFKAFAGRSCQIVPDRFAYQRAKKWTMDAKVRRENRFSRIYQNPGKSSNRIEFRNNRFLSV
jgi:hypothetical protein